MHQRRTYPFVLIYFVVFIYSRTAMYIPVPPFLGHNIVPVFRNRLGDALLFHLLGNTSGKKTGRLRAHICVHANAWHVRRERNRSPHTYGEQEWQSAVDTLVMALGRRDEIGDAIRCISADEGCNLARTPFIKAASLPRRIQGYRCCQHQWLREQQQWISPETSNTSKPDRRDVAFLL